MKTFKNVDVVFLEGDDGKITVSICDGDEFYDLTFSLENGEFRYEKGIGEKYSSSDFSTFGEFYDFMKRNYKNKMSYLECMEKYFPEKKVDIVNNFNFEISDKEIHALSENLKNVIKRIMGK